MKHINLLSIAASSAFAAFLISLVLGVVSMPIFLVSVIAWFSLITVKAYTPRRLTAPRLAPGAVRIPNYRRCASLPFAA